MHPGRLRIRFPAAALACVAIVVGLALGGCARSSNSNSGGSKTPTLVSGGLSLPLALGRSKADDRATIETSIDGQSQILLFDTGSVGISVLATAVPAEVASMTGQTFQVPFDGGVMLSGVIVSLPVEVAGNATSGPIAIQLVQSATCVSGSSNCAAAGGMDAFSKSIGADGILGAGLWSSGVVASPLTQLAWGVPTSIAVTWGGSSGSVTLNPTFDTPAVASLQMPADSQPTLPNGVASWDNFAVPICWQIGDATRTCMSTVLDTGASAMSFPIGFPGGPTKNVKKLSSGQRITGSVSVTSTPFLDFTTGTKLGTDLVTVIPDQSTVNSGLQFFAEFVVVFSLTNGIVLLQPTM